MAFPITWKAKKKQKQKQKTKEREREKEKKVDSYARLPLHNYSLELIEYPVALCTVYVNDDQKWNLIYISLLTYLKVTYCE